MDLDKSLDEMIKAKPRVRRSSRRGITRAVILGKPVSSPASRARAAVKAAATAAPLPAATPQPADKIIVSNLPADVNEAQVRELFSSTVGPLREVTLHYDATGRSKGIASVHFNRKGDGSKAFQQYNNRLIDGMKPMKIEIVVAPATIPLASRVAAAVNSTNGAPRTSRVARRRGGKPGRKSERPVKTAADLDAEMEDYTANTLPTAAAPAATA